MPANTVGGHVIAFGRTVQALPTAEHFRAFRLTDIDISKVLGELAFADNRADLRAVLKRVTDLIGLGGCHQFLDEFVVDIFVHDQAAGGSTFLPRRTKGRTRGMGPARSRSASSITIIGFFDPISIWIFVMLVMAAAAMPRPTPTDPVKLIAFTPRLSTKR